MLHTLLIIIAIYFVALIIIANFWLLLCIAGMIAAVIGIVLLYMFAPAVLGGGMLVLYVIGVICVFASEVGWMDFSKNEHDNNWS